MELDYSSVVIGKDMTKSQFEIEYPDAAGFPYVIIDDEKIGGLHEVVKYLVDKGYGDKLRQR